MEKDTTNSDDFMFYRNVKTGNKNRRTRNRNGRSIEEYVDETKKVYYTETEVANFTLEDLGTAIPFRPGNKTIIENYLLQYWQYFLGSPATMTYINYMSMCYNTNTTKISLERMAELMRISTVTLGEYLKILEDNGFVMRFWAQSRHNKGMNGSTRVKVRGSVPFLSEKQISELPDRMLASHNKFIRDLMESHEVVLQADNDYSEKIEEFMRRGRSQSPSRKAAITNPAEHLNQKKGYLHSIRTQEDINIWERTMAYVSDHLAQSSFDTWFKEVFCLIRDGRVDILTPSSFVSEWIQSRYTDMIIEGLKSSGHHEVGNILISTVESYIH